jgi:hypothetical protein
VSNHSPVQDLKTNSIPLPGHFRSWDSLSHAKCAKLSLFAFKGPITDSTDNPQSTQNESIEKNKTQLAQAMQKPPCAHVHPDKC